MRSGDAPARSTALANSVHVATGTPLTAVMKSNVFRPAWAAGDDGSSTPISGR